jgi:hypothetical protein
MRLLYFSPVPAGSYAQRPHFLVRAWLERGAESVLWVNPYPCRLPQWQDVRRVRGLGDQGTPVDPRVGVLHVPALPVEPLPLGAWFNRRLFWRSAWREMEQFAAEGPWTLGVGRPSALALAAIDELQPTASFFDAMDNFPEFHHGLSRQAMRRHEDAIARRVDLVMASSTFLADKFARRGLHVEKLLNACESNEGLRSLGPRPAHPGPFCPVLGYLGCLGRWFDWPLVVGLAEAMPETRIELVGPCAVRPPRKLPANIRLFPPCKQSEVAGHLSRFTAGLIPFQTSALTAGVDPIKFYEYRAAGLPVLSTSFGEMALRGRDDGVYFLDRASDLAGVVSEAIGRPNDAVATRRFREENDWSFRFEQSVCFRSLLSASRMRRAA